MRFLIITILMTLTLSFIFGLTSNHCNSKKCLNNGICVEIDDNFECICPKNYTGRLCELVTNKCDEQPCQNKGLCENSQGEYICHCLTDFGGKNCENPLVLCDDNGPCLNNGTCHKLISEKYNFMCKCPFGFSGKYCEVNESDCEHITCQNNGILIDNIKSCSCMCQSGFSGKFCEKKDPLRIENEEGSCSDYFSSQEYNSNFIKRCQNGGLCLPKYLIEITTNNTLSNHLFECYCPPMFTGQYCETEKYLSSACPPFSNINPCHNGGECIPDSTKSSGFKCICPEGYMDEFCISMDDYCFNKPCMNNGECFNTLEGYQCKCPKEFNGIICEESISACEVNNQCLNGALCISLDDSNSECKCLDGFTGEKCEINIDDCKDRPCGPNGICIDKISGFNCDCHSNWYGENCYFYIPNPHDKQSATILQQNSECRKDQLDRCSNGAFCIPTSEIPGIEFECKCNQEFGNFTGLYCDVDVNECTDAENPCQNGGQCLNNIGSYYCNCPSDFNGKNCEIHQTYSSCKYQKGICQNGGVCEDKFPGYECKCKMGFEGTFCEIEINECLFENNICKNDGICINHINSTTCLCREGYHGDNCEISSFIDDELNPSTLFKALQTFCFDKPCVIINQCQSMKLGNPCQNGGICEPITEHSIILDSLIINAKTLKNSIKMNSYFDSTELILPYKCHCTAGFTGDRCQEKLNSSNFNLCETIDCGLNRYCELNDDKVSTTCKCLPGWSSFRCEQPVNQNCKEFANMHHEGDLGKICQNGGVCIDELQREDQKKFFSCQCPFQFKGHYCEQLENRCLDQNSKKPLCLNNGTCINYNSDSENFYKCVCQPGFEGVNCEINKNECEDDKRKKCKNDGYCVDSYGEIKCFCPPGVQGPNCEFDFDECQSSPCKNGGLCQDLRNGFHCQCKIGFIGSHCEAKLNFCHIALRKVNDISNSRKNLSELLKILEGTQNFIYHAKEHETNFLGLCDPFGSISCIPEDGNFTCLCKIGYFGRFCEYKLNLCNDREKSFCLNGGHCLMELNNLNELEPVCHCPSGFHGHRCSHFKNICYENNPCLNGGHCLPIAFNQTVNPNESSYDQIQESFKCVCPLGVSGRICEINLLNECEEYHERNENPFCQNNGVCVDEYGHASCICENEFCGQRCELNGKICDHYKMTDLNYWNGFENEMESCVKFGCFNDQIRNNGRCDIECNLLTCEFDAGECLYLERSLIANFSLQSKLALPWIDCTEQFINISSVSPCHLKFRNGKCDPECDSEHCLFDGWDCEFEKKCSDYGDCINKYADGICNPECHIPACNYDYPDCKKSNDLGSLLQENSIKGSLILIIDEKIISDVQKNLLKRLEKILQVKVKLKKMQPYISKIPKLHRSKRSFSSSQSSKTELHLKLDNSECLLKKKNCFHNIEHAGQFLSASLQTYLKNSENNFGLNLNDRSPLMRSILSIQTSGKSVSKRPLEIRSFPAIKQLKSQDENLTRKSVNELNERLPKWILHVIYLILSASILLIILILFNVMFSLQTNQNSRFTRTNSSETGRSNSRYPIFSDNTISNYANHSYSNSIGQFSASQQTNPWNSVFGFNQKGIISSSKPRKRLRPRATWFPAFNQHQRPATAYSNEINDSKNRICNQRFTNSPPTLITICSGDKIQLTRWDRETIKSLKNPMDKNNDFTNNDFPNFDMGSEVQWLYRSLVENLLFTTGLIDKEVTMNSAQSPMESNSKTNDKSIVEIDEPVNRTINMSFQEILQRLGYTIMNRLENKRDVENSKLIDILNSRISSTSFETLMHLAARFNRSDAVQALLDVGADPCIVDQEGRNVLLTAVCASALDVVLTIVRHPITGRNLQILSTCESESKTTPLIQAVKLAEIEIATVLLNVMNGMGSAIAASNQLMQQQLALSNTASSSSTQNFRYDDQMEMQRNSEMNSGLMNSLEDSISQILDVNGVDGFGRSALHWAAVTDQSQLVRILIQSGASIDSQTSMEETSLALAAKEGLVDMCNLLLMAGANPDLADHLDRTPRQLAERYGHRNVTEVFESYTLALNSSSGCSRSFYPNSNQILFKSSQATCPPNGQNLYRNSYYQFFENSNRENHSWKSLSPINPVSQTYSPNQIVSSNCQADVKVESSYSDNLRVSIQYPLRKRRQESYTDMSNEGEDYKTYQSGKLLTFGVSSVKDEEDGKSRIEIFNTPLSVPKPQTIGLAVLKTSSSDSESPSHWSSSSPTNSSPTAANLSNSQPASTTIQLQRTSITL